MRFTYIESELFLDQHACLLGILYPPRLPRTAGLTYPPPHPPTPQTPLFLQHQHLLLHPGYYYYTHLNTNSIYIQYLKDNHHQYRNHRQQQ
jgi:hypothetical protein